MYLFLDPEQYDRVLQDFKTSIIDGCVKCGGTGYLDSDEIDEETLAPEVKLCGCSELWNFRLKQIGAGIPKEFWDVEAVAIENNNECLGIIQRYIANLENARRNGLGFLMMGENGVGKTTMATLILAKAIRAGYSVFYISAHDMMDVVFKAFKDDRLAGLLDTKLNSDFVVIDEIDKARVKDNNSYVLTKVDSILRRRRGIIQPTTLITNMTQTELHSMLGESIMSIVSSSMKQLRFMPGDFRRKQGSDWDNMLNGR